MKVKFQQEIDAKVVVTARLADGEFTATVSASGEYAPNELKGATASASVPIPPELAKQIEDAMRTALEKVGQPLGAELARAAAESYKVSVTHKEIR